MKTRIIAAAAGLLAAATAAYAQAPNAAVDPQHAGTQTPSTEQFVEKAAVANMMEIDAAKIALERSKSTKVREFAQRMVTDHTKVGADMKAALGKSGSAVQPPKEVDAEHRQDLDALRAATPTAFDREYVRSQVQAHDQAVALFTSYAHGGDNPALKLFAQRTLPTLEAHQKMAHEVAEAVGA
jgi:putative membrane protein